MTASITLAPGIYNLMPCESDSEDHNILVPLDPVRYEAERYDDYIDDDIVIELAKPTPGLVPLEGIADTFLLTVDLGDADPEGLSLVTVLGPLSLDTSYVLAPATEITKCPIPDEQCAYNWLAFELAEETVFTVSGPVITIGETVIDLSKIGAVCFQSYSIDGKAVQWGDDLGDRRKDVVFHTHVSYNGDAVNAVLNDMSKSFDDSVLIMPTFTPEHIDRIDAIDTDAARAFAHEMREAMSLYDASHIVLRPYFGE